MSNPHEITGNVNSRVRSAKKQIITVVIVLAIISAAFAVFAFWPGPISQAQAQEIAIAHIGGGSASSATHDFEEFRRTWEVLVFNEGRITAVYVSRFTGQVVYMEFAGW